MKPYRWCVAAGAIAAVACARDMGPVEPAVAPGGLRFVVSSRSEPVGGRIAVAVRLDQAVVHAGNRTAGLQGRITFDPAGLRYLGQRDDARPVVLVGESGLPAGTLRFVAYELEGLPEIAAVFVFEVRGPSYQRGLHLELEAAATASGRKQTGWHRGVRVAEDLDLMLPSRVARLTLDDWSARLGPRDRRSGQMPRLAGDGMVYGDVDRNGSINVFDVLGVANVSVGNLSLLNGVPVDYAVAGDVAPANDPGLGEPDDPSPPGVETSGDRSINVFDVLAIANHAVGNPVSVVGAVIPGRTARPGRVVLSGVLVADRTLYRDTVYELDGTVIVPSGVTLTVAAGTRIEGSAASRGALSIRQGATISAVGTRLEPIVFTCTGSTPAPGCWGGLVLNGAALLNNGNTGGGGLIQCPTKTEPSGGTYGGCLVQTSSGALRYLRVEFAGAPWPGQGIPAAAMALNGVGATTLLEDIQVHAGAGDGVAISGGFAAIRELFVSHPAGNGLRWDDGWRGKLQTAVVYRSSGSGSALRGASASGASGAYPRAHPTVYGLTIVEANPSNPPGMPAILLSNGTGGHFGNLILHGWTGVGLAIDDQETCDRIAMDSLRISTSIFFGNATDFDADADCVDEAAFAMTPGFDNLLADPMFNDAGFSLAPDLRPLQGSPAGTGAMPPPDGFFDPGRNYRGGVPLATVTRSNVPWYAGWTVGQ